MRFHRSLPNADFPRLRFRQGRGFSIVEILVACGVLAILVTILASAFSGFASLASSSGGRLEVNNQVRAAFDRLAFDLGSRIWNDDVQLDFRKNATISGGGVSNNDSLVLLVDARSTEVASRFARIGYEIGRETDAASGIAGDGLLRRVEPFWWSDDLLNASLTSAAVRQLLGGGIFRMEISFLKRDGTVVASPPPQDDISAVIVSTAALDERTLSKLSVDQLSSLAQELPDAVDGKLPMAEWRPEGFVSVSRAVAQGVRFHQRYFYLR